MCYPPPPDYPYSEPIGRDEVQDQTQRDEGSSALLDALITDAVSAPVMFHSEAAACKNEISLSLKSLPMNLIFSSSPPLPVPVDEESIVIGRSGEPN
jgi:hypothetical protein